MGQRLKVSAEYACEAVALFDIPGVTVSKIAAERGIGGTVLGRWRRELRARSWHRRFGGSGRSRDEDLTVLRRELARVTKERDFLREASAFAESFFGVLKRERVNRPHDRTRAEARADICDYIERCHNPRQRRRLEMQQRREDLVTHPSVNYGVEPDACATSFD